jgi:hypothetical protein
MRMSDDFESKVMLLSLIIFFSLLAIWMQAKGATDAFNWCSRAAEGSTGALLLLMKVSTSQGNTSPKDNSNREDIK